MKQFYLLCAVLLVNTALFAQPQQVNMSIFHSCNGATITPFVIWSGTPVPVTVHYERQGAAGTWITVVSQVYDVQTSYIVVSPTDISGATNYRIRAVDMTTLQEYISVGGAVNPALWNNNRGTPFFTATPGWGSACDNSQNYIAVSINSTTNGRPPFRVEYKPGTQPNFLVAGECNGFMYVMGILPNTVYQVRVVDYCGNITNTQNVVLSASASATILQNATTCDNGRIQVSALGGVGPFEYGLGKVVAGMSTIVPEFTYQASSIFENLAPGDYYVSVRDGCGNVSSTGFARLGGGFPRIDSERSIPANDSCSRNLTVTTFAGDGPFEYGIRYMLDNQYSWQTSNVFTNLTREGVYYLRVKDKCGQLSDSVLDNIGTIPKPVISSTTHTNLPGCEQSIQVHASGGYKPYEYSRNMFNWKATDTFNNLAPGIYYLYVRDRCGRVSPYFMDTVPYKDLTLHISAVLDSCGASTGHIAVDSITDGLAPIQYAIRNLDAPGGNYTPFTTDSIFRNLPAGYYSIKVIDACGAEKAVDSIRLGSTFTYEHNLLPGGINCSPFLSITLHGSTRLPYTYFITNGVHNRSGIMNDSLLVLGNFPDGTYTITIIDACGDTATSFMSPPVINGSGVPQLSFEVQYLNGCTEANIIMHGAPAGSFYQLWHVSGAIYERSDSVFTSADYGIVSGKYYVVVYNNDFCNFSGFFYEDTVTVALSDVVLTGTINPAMPDSVCIYNTSVRLTDYLLDAYPGGTWSSTAMSGFDAAGGTFNPSLEGAGEYTFTYAITDSCGSLQETSFILTVAMEACQIRTIAGDYHASLQPEGCTEITGGQFSWIDITDNKGNLLFSINPLGRELGPLCAGIRIVNGNGSSLRSTVIDGKTTYFLDRNFYIECENPYGNSPVMVMLYFTNEEVDNMLNFLRTNGYPNASTADIRLLQKGGDDVDLSVTNEGALNSQRFVIITPVMYQNENGWVAQFEVYNFSEFNAHFTGANANLPLTLLDFTGASRQGQVRLQWKTVDEENTSHFDLERSNDGNLFQSIARINASGNSVAVKAYTYDDLQPLNGNNFYRLKMVDKDGKFTYSKTILVRTVNLPGLRITPNPARDHFFVSIPGNIKAKAIRIYDATGRILYHEIVNGNQLLKVQTGHLRNGWYLLELQTAGGSFREGFLKH